MADFNESPQWLDAVARIETTDSVLGGEAGASNRAPAVLADRTRFLLEALEALADDFEAHAHSWGQVTGKPTTFPPSSHTHAWSQITGVPSSFTPSAHSHSWSSVTGKPTTFPPSSHGHAWSELSGVPSSFTPSAHSHSWASVTGKPSTFAPSTHSHAWSQITGIPSSFTPSAHSHPEYAAVNHSHTYPSATTSQRGDVELATTAETQSGTLTTRAVTPAGLKALTSTTARAGLIERATTAEAAAGTDSIRAATPAGLRAYASAKLYPVGSIYINATVSTNPATLLGFGTWISFGAGRVMVGLDPTDASFNQAQETGGSETHYHTMSVPRDGWGSLQYGGELPEPTTAGRLVTGSGNVEGGENLESLGLASANRSVNTASQNHMPPYIVVRMWRRIA